MINPYRSLPIFLGILLSTILIANSIWAAKNPSAMPDKKELATVIVQKLQEITDTKRIIVPVKVEAKWSALVVAETEGFVTKIIRPLGSKVKKGETILFIENKDPAFTFAAVPVRAPVAGIVSQMNPAEMSRVGRGDRLFTVMDPTQVKLMAEIPGADLAMIQLGTMAEFKANLLDDKKIMAKVIAISPMVDPQTSTASARLEFNNDKKLDLPTVGTIGFVTVEKSRGSILTVPESALSYTGGKPIVKILGLDNKVESREVELGEQRESQLIIKSGLAMGDQVIVRASRSVKSGEQVEVQAAEK